MPKSDDDSSKIDNLEANKVELSGWQTRDT